MKKLFLFDIDGTLVDINKLHLKAHNKAYKEVLGVNVPDELTLSTFGMSGTECRKKIIDVTGKGSYADIPKIEDYFNKFLFDEIKNKKIESLPGVVGFLELLSNHDKNILGIVTGNREDLGKEVLDKAGLLKYFKVLSFDKGKSREEIVKYAIEQGKCDKNVVFGDTANDIKAGKANNCFTIGVATGSCTVEELKDADLVIKSFQDSGVVENLLNIIM